MTRLTTSLIAALLSASVTAGSLAWIQHHRERDAAELRRQNVRMKSELDRREAAMAEAPAPARNPGVVPEDAEPRVVNPSPVRQMQREEYYRDEGNATPLAVLQTFAWACDRGDVAMVGDLIHVDEPARMKLGAYMDSLPEDIRRQWTSLDDMVASMFTRGVMERPFPNADILETAAVEPISEDRVKLRMPNVPRDGTECQRVGAVWRIAITENMVDEYLTWVTRSR